jgi:hypothetical protein
MDLLVNEDRELFTAINILPAIAKTLLLRRLRNWGTSVIIRFQKSFTALHEPSNSLSGAILTFCQSFGKISMRHQTAVPY